MDGGGASTVYVEEKDGVRGRAPPERLLRVPVPCRHIM